MLDLETESTAVPAAASEKGVYCLEAAWDAAVSQPHLTVLWPCLPVCCVAFSGCWGMLVPKMFVANQGIANCNQTLFPKLATLFSDTVAIKRVMTFLTLTPEYLNSLPVIVAMINSEVSIGNRLYRQTLWLMFI